MQDTRKPVRYYIDRDDDAPVIRTVPVTRPLTEALAQPKRTRSQPSTTTHRVPNAATAHAEHESRRRSARRRISSMVRASVGKNRDADRE